MILTHIKQQLVELYAGKDKQLLEEYDVMSFEQRISQIQLMAIEAEDKGRPYNRWESRRLFSAYIIDFFGCNFFMNRKMTADKPSSF